MILIPMLLALATTASAAPGTVTPRASLTPAVIDHSGDRRPYVVYSGKALIFDVEPPATVEIAVRARLKKDRNRAQLQLRVKADRQVLLDQSQVLSEDRRARGGKLTRPLVAVADIPPGTRRFTIEVKSPTEDVDQVVLAVTAVEVSASDAPGPDVNDDAMVPDLVSLSPPPAESAAPSPTRSTTPSPATTPGGSATVSASAPYQPTRYVGVELGVAFGLGVPGVELSLRYFPPFLDERLSAGLRVGYGLNLASAVMNPVVAPTQVLLTLHLIPVVLFVEGEALRVDTGAGRWFLGARVDGGVVPYFGSLVEEVLLRGGDARRIETGLAGLGWCAGGALTSGLDTSFGALTAELGFLYAPDAEARSDADPRRAMRTRVLGPRAAIGYRFAF